MSIYHVTVIYADVSKMPLYILNKWKSGINSKFDFRFFFHENDLLDIFTIRTLGVLYLMCLCALDCD